MNPDERRKFLWTLKSWNPEHEFRFEGDQLIVRGPELDPDPTLLQRAEEGGLGE